MSLTKYSCIVLMLLGCSSIAGVRREVNTIEYWGQSIDNMPVESLRFNAIVKDAEIHVRMNDPIAGKKVLEKIIPHIPIVRQDAGLPIKPIGVFNIGYTNGDSLILYTDGEFICLADFSACTKANSALRVFADPSYDAAHAVFRVIKR